MGREGLQGWMWRVCDETDSTVEAGKGIEESRAQTLGGGGCGILVEDEDGVFVAVAAESIPVGFELGEGFGFAVGALGTVSIDEFAGVEAEELETLFELGFGELGKV
jgi:hypothetical protein